MQHHSQHDCMRNMQISHGLQLNQVLAALSFKGFMTHSYFYCSQCSTRCQNDCRKNLKKSHGMKWMHMQTCIRGNCEEPRKLQSASYATHPRKWWMSNPSNAKANAQTEATTYVFYAVVTWASHRCQSENKSTQVLYKILRTQWGVKTGEKPCLHELMLTQLKQRNLPQLPTTPALAPCMEAALKDTL